MSEIVSVIEQNILPSIDSTRLTGETGERLAANSCRLTVIGWSLPISKCLSAGTVKGFR